MACRHVLSPVWLLYVYFVHCLCQRQAIAIVTLKALFCEVCAFAGTLSTTATLGIASMAAVRVEAKFYPTVMIKPNLKVVTYCVSKGACNHNLRIRKVVSWMAAALLPGICRHMKGVLKRKCIAPSPPG